MNAILASRINPAGATAIELSGRYPVFAHSALLFRPSGATAIEYSRRTPAYALSRFAVRSAGQAASADTMQWSGTPTNATPDIGVSDVVPAPSQTAGALASAFGSPGGVLLGTLGTGIQGGISPGEANPTIIPGEQPAPDTSGSVPDVATSAAKAGMTPSDQTALFDAVSSGLNTAGSTIANIINSGDAVQIAQLQTQTAAQIAALNLQASQARAAGNIALANQNAARAAQLAQFQQAFLMQPQSRTGLYIVAGAVVLGIIGTFVYLGASTRRRNPAPYRKSGGMTIYAAGKPIYQREWDLLVAVANKPGISVAALVGDSLPLERTLKNLKDQGLVRYHLETVYQPLSGPGVHLTAKGEELVESGSRWAEEMGRPRSNPRRTRR